ncbi:unannotated protein [freshwater metagenome]|uniref:Unannotated protein n=1 Tax=freshwater metagenome TaxID=449393 RepID=A0A6J6W519_9ZZZZ
MEDELATIFKFNAGPNPRRAILMGAIEQPVNPGVTVEQEHARHAKSHTQPHAVGLEQHEFSPAISASDG